MPGRYRACSPSRSRAGGAGWTLVELVIVLAVLTVLVALAVSVYVDWVTKSRRADGHALLYAAAQRQQQVFSRCGSFTDDWSATGNCMAAPPVLEGLAMSTNASERGYYTLSIEDYSTTTFTLRATAQAPQDSDSECLDLTLDHTGQKGCIGGDLCDDPTLVSECW